MSYNTLAGRQSQNNYRSNLKGSGSNKLKSAEPKKDGLTLWERYQLQKEAEKKAEKEFYSQESWEKKDKENTQAAASYRSAVEELRAFETNVDNFVEDEKGNYIVRPELQKRYEQLQSDLKKKDVENDQSAQFMGQYNQKRYEYYRDDALDSLSRENLKKLEDYYFLYTLGNYKTWEQQKEYKAIENYFKEIGWTKDDIALYREYMESRVNQRNTEQMIAETQEYIEEHPVMGSIVSSAKAVISAPLKIFGMVESIKGAFGLYESSIKPTDIYSPWFSASNYSFAVKDAVSAQIDSDTWKSIYNGAMGVAETLVTTAVSYGITGGIGGLTGSALSSAVANTTSLLLGSQTAVDTTIQAIKMGYSNQAAFALGLARGSIDVLTEKVGLDKVLGNTVGLARTLKNGFIAEGISEVEANWLNRLLDYVVLNEETELSALVDEYIKQGNSPLLALSRAIIKQDGESFLRGGIAGMTMSAMHYRSANRKTAKGYITGENTHSLLKDGEEIKISDTDSGVAALIEEGLDSPQGSYSRKLAENLLDRAQ